MDQKEFDAILKSHKHAEESPGDIADRIIGMGQPKRTIGGTLKDIGVTSVNAAIGAGEAVVGLADLATGGMAGKGLSQLGYDPKAARNFLQQYKSEAQQAADRRVDEAKGFGGTLKAYLRNPSTIVEAGAESLPSMFLGGGIGRGIGAAGKAAGILSNPAARAGLLGAIGEGVVGAGSAAEQIRQETGELTGKGAASAIGSGVGTGVLGRLGNKLAPKLGAVDIEEALVRGFSGNARNVPLSFGKTLKAITGGAISEGAFEELPQSIQEQVWQNYATGKPLMEGVPEGAAQGLVTGAAMGGAVNIHSALPGQQRKALAELEQKRQAELAQEHDKLVREATRGQVVLQAATGQNLPGVSSAGLNFDGGSGLPPGVAPYMAGQNVSTFDLMREQQQRQAQTALDLEQRQQAAREQVLQQERIQNQLAANGFGYAPGQRAAVHGAPDEMASALAGETEEEYQQRLGNLEQRRQQGQQGLINVLQNRVDMQRQNAQATAGAIAKAAQAAKQQEDEQAQRDRFDQWAAAERAAGRDVGPFSMDEQQQAKAASSGPLGKAAAKGFGALNEAERAVEYGRIFDRGATNTQAIEQIQAERERAFLGDGESSDAGLPEFRQELAANRRERVAQGLPATLTPDAKAAATIEGVGFRQQPGSKLPPELDYQVSRMEAQLQESITGTHEANVDQNGDTVWLKGKGYWPQWMEKKTMPRGKWAKQGTQEREDQAEDLKNANILHDAGRDKILAVIDKARKGVALGSHEKSIWSAVERIASQPGGPALWGQSDMLIADANEAAANERMQARYGLSMLPKPMTVRVADIEPGETLAVDGMVEDAVGKTVLYTHKGIDAQGNTIMERGEHDAVTGKTGAARVMRFEPTDHLEGVIGVRERADREQNPNRTTKAYNREGKAFRSIEKQGIAITEPQNIPVDMLRPGDRVVIRDPQGMPDVATMRGYDSNNRAVIRDGIEYHLQADDNITVEGFRAKGEVRQTKGFGYRPKNERQQIAREYEQDRQERAERSEILREAKTQVRGELTNTLRQIAGKRRIHAEEQRALATQANKRQQAGADSKQGTPQAVMPKGSRPTVSLGYGFHPGDNTPTLERARAQKQEQKENRKTFPGTQYETGEQRVRENRRNFPATKYETGKPGRIEREAFARPTGYQQVKPAADALRENKRQSGLARQQEGEARPQGIIRGGTDNDRALAHEQYQAVLDFAAGKLRRENAGLSTREARRQAVQQLGLEEKAVPETGWWRERAGKSPGYLANLLSKSAAKRTKTHVEHSSGSNPYFLSTEKSTIVPLKDLLSSEPKLDAARVDRARANMDAAVAGTGAKRKPLPVYRRSDGKLVALDGNSTLAVLRERGEKSAIVEIKKTIKQPRATLDEIYADAAKADVVLRKSLADFVERTGGRLVSRPDGQIKSRERAEQKARQDNTPRKLKDIVAHTLVYPDQKTLMQALPQLEKEYGPIELKNRFENPPDSGYRDILANVRVKEANGHIAEIQLTTEAMLQAKEGLGHKIYEVQRELDDIAKRTSNAEATELALEFDKISKEYYEAAAQSSSSSKSATASSSALFRLTLSPDLNKTLARASELLVSMNSSPNIRKSVLDLESSLKGVPSQSKYRSSMESSPVAEEKSSGSGENIQQKAAQSEENQAPAGKTEAREAAAPGKSEVPVILPPGNLKNEKIEITKRGRKWLKGKRFGKNYEIKIEINDVSRDWQAGQTVEFPAHVEVEQSKYGITTTSYPLTAEQVAQARVQAVLPDIKRWLGYVEEKAHEGHVYQNGVQKLRELGIASLPEYQKRLDAALASVKERKEAEATREASEGRTWLRVPYADKDHAKKHGARFDGDRKQWYVIGKDVPEALEQYLPDDSGGGRPNDKRPGNGQPEQKEAGQYTISNGSGYGGSPYKTGETIRSNRKDLPEYVTVIRASQRYYGEDGMSFGVGDDSGYVYTATVREATREEAAPVRAREEAKKARKQAKEMLLSIAREIRENGDRPELQGAPAGVRIDMPGNPENIHGGGEWFVIGQDRVWHVRNNGADGDDWSANNIRTGGAGAIGFAIPFDRGLAGRLVGALEAAGADIPQAARKLTEGESGPRESRTAGGDVVATLNGEEVLSATGETIFEKARNYYRDNLQGKDVYREGLGAVRVTGKGWGKLKRGLKTDELKARLIPGIPALIRDGAIGAREPVTREDGIVAFYHITGNVRIGDEIVQAGISVGEDGFGNLFYNMNHDTEVLWEKRKARLLPRSEAGGGEPSTDKGLSMKKSIGDQTGFVNLHVLGRAEEQQTKALPESERANIEGELAASIGELQTRRLFGSIGQVKILDTQEDAQRVIASGHIVKTEVRHSKGGAIQGITMPDGQVYLVRDGIAKGQAMPVLLHELGEHAAQLGFKDMQYRAILRSLERQAKDDSETGRAIRKGIARARAAGVRPDNKYYWSEVAAYTIEENADVHTSLLDRIVNYFKGLFLKVCGVQAGKFSHKDLVMFAKASVKAAARRGAQFGKYDPQKSLWSADESQTGLRSISEALAQREYDEVVKRYKGTAQWLKAPNGKPSNLNERQWVQVRTPSFKKWFGDWESLATARAIRDLVPVDAANVQEISSKRDIENYFRNNSAVTNTRNGVTVSFPIATAGKIYHHKGLPVGRIVGRLKEIFEHSIPFLSEKEDLKEGHKAHPNIDSFDHYVGKVSLGEGAGGGEYYVRFTVRKEVVGKKGNTPRQETHNVAVSDVQIYEKPDAANLTGNTPGEGSQPAFVDSKLRDFFAKVKSEEVSTVLDANGEPLVVYHGSGEQRNIITPGMRDPGAWFTSNFRNAANYAKGDESTIHDTFLAIKNPLVVTFDYGEDGDLVPFINGEAVNIDNNVDLVEYAQRRGYDGVHFPEGNFTEEDDTWVAFQEEQIKSATDNTGDFDSENPDIRYSRRKAGEITTLFQTAYHGSPYRFSGFTLENIGGGEGAQVHGWGLYFALDRDMSEGYLAKLGDDNPAYKTIYGSGVKTNDGWIWADESDPENGWTLPSGSADDIALEAMEDAGGVQKDAISALEERLEDLRDDIDLELEEGEELEDALKENEEYQNVLEALGFLRDVEYERTSSGQLYEVDIPDDDVMLREDAALEEQPEQVREAVKKLFAEHGLDPDDAGNGREIYEELSETLGGDEDASRALNEAGVRGIRYNGDIDGECAVVFDDKAIEILDTFYQAEAQGSLDDVLKQLYGQIMKSGESRNARTPWTEKTSKAIIMGPHGSARKSNESLYRAAKEGGDPKAAYELVAPLVTKEGVDAIRAKLRDVTSAVVVPVVSEERLGRNKIPRAYADILADRLGAQVAVDIVHINKVNRSGSDGFHRLAAQPEFDGAVEAGREYIIVDDTLAQGGTLASLKGFIEQKGGRVVAISALTGKDYSAKLRPNTADLALLRKKYPELEAFWYEEFGYGFDRLTSSEANYLCTVKGHTFDTIRDRILAERRQGGASNHSGSDSTGQSGGPASGSLDSKSHFPSFKSAGKGDGVNPSSDSGHTSSRTRFQQVREQINRILPNKDEARAIIAIIEARAFSAGLTPEEFVTKRGLTFVDAELPVNPQGKLLEKMMGGQLRGAFNVRDYVEEGRAIITAFRGNANVSTLAHELGHLFRQDLKRYGQDRLLAMAEHWAGVKNGRWNREQEEKFARGFEAYLLEGKAPTTAMGKVFERFRVWISRLYGALVGSQLNVGLDDEIRSVFDALLTEHAAEDAGDAFAEGIAKTRARIAELEGSGPIDLDHRTLFQIGLADSGGAGNTFTGWTSAINRIMSSHPKWRDRWERFIYNMVDTNDPRERIWKAVGSPDAQDIVTVERLRGKKAAAEQKTFRDGMVTPLLKTMAAAGLKASDLEEYAHAMHAPERNQRMREVNAKRVLESLLRQMPAKDADEYRELINLAQSGLRQGWDTTDVQRFYLDQMQKIFNDLSAREQQCNALARTATSNAAQQRVAKMQEQIAESYRIRDKWRTESQRFAGITDGEAQSIVAKWRQDKRFAAIEDARQQLSAISRATLDTLHEAGELGDEEYQALRNGYQYYVPLHRDGFQDTRPATGRVTGPTGRPFKVAKGSMLEVVNILPEVIRAHETAINRKHKLEAGRALYEFALAHPDAGITVEKQEQMPTHDREGNIVMYTRQTEPEDGVFVKVKGKRYLLRFEADVRTPEGRTLARFLDSIKGQDAQLGGITKSLHKITRLLAAVNTSLSPEFVVSNFSRDLQTALIHLNQEDINMQGLQSQVLKSVGKAVRGIWLAERGKPGNNEMARWYRDFEKNGGKVGWVQNYDGIEDLSKKLAGEMKLYEPGNRARKITRAVLDFIDAGNVAIENALRLATYKAMVEKGIDRAKAAGIASNLTVDFTRKGKLSPQINALYMFFNASVQGSYRMAKALATSPRVRKIAGGIAASGFLLQMLALAGGGDDDSDEPYVLGLPDSTRERYILIPMPGQDGRFFKFPKAYGYGALYDLGAEVANSMYMGMTGRQYNHAKGAMRVVSSFANSFNPIQSATILQTIAPTLVDPFVYVGENTNWTGLPLRPAQNNFGPKKPESGRAWKNTNPIYKSIAEGVNSLTGGDRYESGLVDISPEVFEMAVNTALGGLGRFIGNTAALPLATAKGELDAEKIPFVRQVYAKWDDRALSNRYYEAMERAQIARMRFKNAETLAEKRSIFDSPEYKIWRQSNATDKQVKRLRARLNRMEAAGNTVGADYLRKQIVGLQSKVLSTIM